MVAAASAEPRTIRVRALRATLLSLIGQGVAQALRLGGNLILTRLLFPEAFGLMAQVTVFLVALEMLSDVGVRPAIVQSARGDDPRFRDTAFTLGLARGVLLALVGLAAAYPYAAFYDERLRALLPVAVLTTFAAGATSTKLAAANRHLQVGRFVALEIGAQIGGLLVMIGVAYLHRTPWALVMGALVQTTLLAAGSHLFLEGRRDRLGWDPAAAREIFRFSRWIFLSTLIAFLAQRFDVLTLGKLVPVEALGVYSQALALASLPWTVFARVIDAVLLPALSESARVDEASFRERFLAARRLVVVVVVLLVLGPSLLGPAFFLILYDHRYADAGWMVQLLMFNLGFQLLELSWLRAVLALGLARVLAVASSAKLIATAAGAVAGHALFGMPGFILGLGCGSLVAYGIAGVVLRHHGAPVLSKDLRLLAPAALLAIVAYWAPDGLRLFFPRASTAALAVASGLALYLPVLVWGARELLRMLKGSARPAVSP